MLRYFNLGTALFSLASSSLLVKSSITRFHCQEKFSLSTSYYEKFPLSASYYEKLSLSTSYRDNIPYIFRGTPHTMP